MERAGGEGKRPHMLHIFSFQGWREGDAEQSGFDKSASGGHGHLGSSLTTVGDGDTSEVAAHTLPASFSFLHQTKSQMGILFITTWTKKSDHLRLLMSGVAIHASRIHHGFNKSHQSLWKGQISAEQKKRGN